MAARTEAVTSTTRAPASAARRARRRPHRSPRALVDRHDLDRQVRQQRLFEEVRAVEQQLVAGLPRPRRGTA